MKLSGATDSTIMRIGLWTSLMYLTYIHSHDSALSTGIAWKMSRELTFQNVNNFAEWLDYHLENDWGLGLA